MSDQGSEHRFRAATLQDALALAADMEQRGEFARVEAVYRKLLERRPDEPALQVRLGAVLLRSGRAVEAADWLTRAARADLRNADTLMLLARALERARRPYDAIDALHRASGVDPNREDARAMLQIVARRVTRLEEAIDRLRGTAGQQAPAKIRGAALIETAATYDAMGMVNDAVRALQQGQQTVAMLPETMRFSRETLPAQIRGVIGGLSEDMTRNWSPPSADDDINIVALVGLLPAPARPLSGLLSALPGLAPRSGAPAIALAAQALNEIAVGASEDPARLAELSDAEIDNLRARFHRVADDALGGDPDVALLDASPLALTRLHVLKRLAPGAKVVMALRDPRDEVLACLFQRYRPNALSVHLHQSGSAANALADLWSLWKRVKATLDLDILEVRLEDLLATPEISGRRVVSFLGRQWGDEAARWADAVRVAAVQEAETPEPGPGRWRMYTTLLAPAMETLEPVAREMGYSS